ncbi:ArsR/SmtB family transcription factor [Actinokineospora globicatena]|uniref:Transcriptional regulator n=1 Tax=Actinokineospora globicatena TaxID=103729 RepID=A0A9W6QQD4_9PSEU|nr:helix-turn-helix domain-containing protein [Actinokineospora globicatena]MCP2306659.1 Helix-turn-helix domain-containing protein [Actinokineospora globicatena]GLW82225.1 transcriptional regulator [Actinokineospora globicatena]GLW89018.1 transcriptional regulator [Actinokineospora globicatena]GLW95011.1 transcriptional regulator [Actinokineospora globicatena]
MVQRPRYNRVGAETLKVIAHPLRMRMLGVLRAHGPNTATGLAARLGESSGTTSWHLRQLADAGFIEQDTERGNRRERWWRAAQDVTQVVSDTMPDDPETQDAYGTFLTALIDLGHERATRYVRTRHELPEPWRHVSELSDWRMSLTPDELRELAVEVNEVVNRYRRDPADGDEIVTVQVQLFPSREDT